MDDRATSRITGRTYEIPDCNCDPEARGRRITHTMECRRAVAVASLVEIETGERPTTRFFEETGDIPPRGA
jgi:hypothetical protein